MKIELMFELNSLKNRKMNKCLNWISLKTGQMNPFLIEFCKNSKIWPKFSQKILWNWLNSISYVKIAIFHFELNNLLNWTTRIILNWIIYWIESQQIIWNGIIFWIEFSWNDLEPNIELNQFWAKFEHWIESIWVSNSASS